MFIRPGGRLAEMLANRADLLRGFEIDAEELQAHRNDVAMNHPAMDAEEREALAVYTTLFHPNSAGNQAVLAEVSHIDGAALHHIRAMNAQLRDSAQTREAVLAATHDATATIAAAISEGHAAHAERVVSANAEKHDVLARGIQTFANRAAEQTERLITVCKAAHEGAIRAWDDQATLHFVAEQRDSYRDVKFTGTIDQVRGAVEALAQERREADALAVTAAAEASNARRDAEAQAAATATVRWQHDVAARVSLANLADSRAEARERHAAQRTLIYRWIQIVILLAILGALCATKARAQGRDSLVIQLQSGGSLLGTAGGILKLNCATATYTNHVWTCAAGGGGGATIPSITNLIKGDGAGNGADSGIAPGNVVVTTGTYLNPAWITGLAAAKVSGLATVATTGVYSDLTGKPTIPTVTGGTCTNQAATAISGSAVPTCTTITSAYVDSSIAPTASPALTTPTVATSEALTNSALGTTPAGGYSLTNATAAAAGAQQVSPPLTWTGQGWKTTATAASQSVAYSAYVLPVQGTTNPSGLWNLQASVNGAAAVTVLQVDSAGNVIVPTSLGVSNSNNNQIFDNSGGTAWAFSGNTNPGLNLKSGAMVSFSSNGSYSGTKDVFLTRNAAATIQHGNADAAAPVAQTIRMQGVVAGTSNTAGVTATIKGSAGTGTGAGGDLVFQIARAGTTGTAQNAYTTGFTVSGTSGAPVLPSVTFANLAVAPTVGTMVYCTDCVSGTFDATAAGSGTGTPVTYQNGNWKVK